MNEFLKKASKAYYDGNPIISDQQFDYLVDQYGFDEIGAKPQGKTGKHMFQMWSLQKHYADEGKSPLSEYPETSKVRSPKLDGASLDITYVDTKFVKALTRGDGTEGQDVTHLFLATKLIPMTIRLDGVVQITGEIVAPKEVENSRNYAAGALNLKSVEEFKTRAISFFAYGIQPYQSETFSEDMVILKKLGFDTIFTKNLIDIYPTDGIVFRLDSYKEFDKLGYTSKHPRGAFALKERQEAVETILLDVEWTTSKSGRVNPVAILEPVKVGDAIVSRATLNNKAFIENLELYIGCTVGVVRSGDVIPTIVYKAN